MRERSLIRNTASLSTVCDTPSEAEDCGTSSTSQKETLLGETVKHVAPVWSFEGTAALLHLEERNVAWTTVCSVCTHCADTRFCL